MDTTLIFLLLKKDLLGVVLGVVLGVDGPDLVSTIQPTLQDFSWPPRLFCISSGG